jgi:hypothetical protein
MSCLCYPVRSIECSLSDILVTIGNVLLSCSSVQVAQRDVVAYLPRSWHWHSAVISEWRWRIYEGCIEACACIKCFVVYLPFWPPLFLTDINTGSWHAAIIATKWTIMVIRSIPDSARIVIQVGSQRYAVYHEHNPTRIIVRFHTPWSADWTLYILRYRPSVRAIGRVKKK